MGKLGEVVTTIPTIGFNVEEVEYKNISFTVWDIGGQDKIRKLWRYYYHGTDGAIFVVDANDRDRIEDAREELYKMINEEEMRDAAVLVFANNHDCKFLDDSDACVLSSDFDFLMLVFADLPSR